MNDRDEMAGKSDFSAKGIRKRVEEHLNSLNSFDVTGDHQLNPALGRADSRMELSNAAVLIPVVDRGENSTLMLTRRADHLPTHAGQVAFPGGKVERTDTNEIATALRECEEEIGLSREYITPLVTLPPYLAFSGFRIHPVLALVADGFKLSINRNEVEAVFEVPLSFLMTPRNHSKQSREVNGKQRHYYVMPYQEHHIWGVTAGIIRNMYERIFAEC